MIEWLINIIGMAACALLISTFTIRTIEIGITWDRLFMILFYLMCALLFVLQAASAYRKFTKW